MGVKISVVAAGIGAIFALIGALMIFDATRVANVVNEAELQNGWILVGLAVVMWLIALIAKKL